MPSSDYDYDSYLSTKYVPITAPRRPRVFKLSVDDRKDLTLSVSHRISVSEKNESPDYFLLSKIFAQSKKTIVEKRCKKHGVKLPSTAILTLQQKLRDAIAVMQKEKSDFSFFTVDNLEKLLISQHEHEERVRTSQWLKKLTILIFISVLSTKEFFTELRKRHNICLTARPIFDSSGNLSKNFDDTLKNWSEYYKNLYFSQETSPRRDELLERQRTF